MLRIRFLLPAPYAAVAQRESKATAKHLVRFQVSGKQFPQASHRSATSGPQQDLPHIQKMCPGEGHSRRSKSHGAPASPAEHNGAKSAENCCVPARCFRYAPKGKADQRLIAAQCDNLSGPPRRLRNLAFQCGVFVGAAGQHGASGVMAERLVWDQEERFKSGIFHHERCQRGDMTCLK